MTMTKSDTYYIIGILLFILSNVANGEWLSLTAAIVGFGYCVASVVSAWPKAPNDRNDHTPTKEDA